MKTSQQETLAAGKNERAKPVMTAAQAAYDYVHQRGGYSPKELGTEQPYIDLIEATRAAFQPAITDAKMPPAMAKYLAKDNHIFSGLKTNAQLQEAARLLVDEHGLKRPLESFRAEVLKLNKAYNENYLEAEYQFATQSAQMAAKWVGFEESEGRYNLQYRTAKDDHVRASHRPLDETTLPADDPFWSSYYPPNGWRCRCTVVEVRKGKYQDSDSAEAQAAGDKATTEIGKDGKNKLEIFRFNPGKDKALFPPNNPYTKVAGAERAKAVIRGGEAPDNAALRQARDGARVWGKSNIPERGKAYAIGRRELPELLYKNADIKSIIGKPHRHIEALCDAVPRLPELLKTAKYLGSSEDIGGKHPGVEEWLYYEFDFMSAKSYFNVMKEKRTGDLRIHSVSDDKAFDFAKIKNRA